MGTVRALVGFSFDDEPRVNSKDELTVAIHSGRSLFFRYSDQFAEGSGEDERSATPHERRFSCWRGSKRGLVDMVVGGRGLWHVALNLDIRLPLASLGNLEGGLHPKQGVHVRAESLLHPQGHVGRERGAAVEKGRERGPGHAKGLGGFRNRETERLDDLHPDELSRMGRACHAHHGFRFLSSKTTLEYVVCKETLYSVSQQSEKILF